MGIPASGMPRSRALGATLRRVRNATGMSLRDASQHLGVAHSTVGRWESGDIMPGEKEVTALLAVLKITGADSEEILALVRDADKPEWLASGPPGVSQQLAGVMECERTARSITEWAPLVIPGLLQTSDYARAVIGRGRQGDSEVETLVMLRMGRRDVFMRPEPAEFEALIAEPVVRGGIGGPKVMGDQLRHLLVMGQLDAVTVRLVDMAGEWHPGHAGPFLLYKFGIQSPIVYLEHHRSGTFLGAEADMAAYDSAMDMIREEAMSPEQSADRIAAVLAEMENA